MWLAALFAILPVVAASVIGSAVTVPQIPSWYAGLAKPPFNPPNWLFAPVWTTLFALMALAAFRTLRRPVDTPGKAQTLLAYHVQLALNMLWSCVFFGLNSPAGGLVVITLLLAAMIWTMRCFAALSDRLSMALFVPYLAWVAFASLLNASIWWLNR
ncbi:TspO/MBR family protein [Bosea sp. (in: a-proteobacteria)]|uniref:TspO/MBR family protein n=1 Tax=Bosea sp. (in: a-proteobacteria) TaxID=1871050 RepID=UPI002DDCCA0C|nr:TspO/MBR family protein [Bosea sp. (in: a-proteobacteria)]HEV2511766.1 TspO/MBR family protein [Bosea sp. (in: a-proteobacteria)]